MQTLGARFAHGLVTLSDAAAALACRACGIARRRLPVPRHRRDRAGGGRGARHGAPAQRARPFGRAHLARHGAALGAGAPAPGRRDRTPARACAHDDAVENAMLAHAAFGGSTNLVLHLPAVAHAAGLRVADGRRLAAREPRSAAARGRASQRPPEPSDRARLPRRRRARGAAAPAAHGPPRAPGRSPRPARRSTRTSTGGRRANGGAACASGCARPTASIPTTS